MLKHVVLVDFDGVILRNKKPQEYIQKNIHMYMRKVTNISCEKTLQLYNKELYSSYGHTLLGLREHGYDVTLRDFNSFVYDKGIDAFELTNDERQEFNTFTSKMNDMGVNVQVFSNAHHRWLSNFIKNSNTLDIRKNVDGYFDTSYFNKLLKPNMYVYDIVNNMYPKHKKIFLDDKLINFRYTISQKDWINIWVNDSQYIPFQNKNMKAAKGLNDAARLIHTLVKGNENISTYDI
jgi:methionine salvage enolase-phosphatase E1